MLRERRPGAAVGEHVLRYCAYAERTGAPTRQREPLSPSVVLIFGIGSRLRVEGEALETFVGGLGDVCPVIEHDGEMHGIQVDLDPLGARMLLGVPMHELARRSVPLEEVMGAEAHVLEERLYEARSWDERIEIVDRTLERKLRDAPAPPPDVTWAWKRLVQSDGRLRTSEVAAALGCSGKHLAARFREHVGLPPKTVARIARFKRATELLSAHSLAEVAHACGYYDQSHLDRDFRDFAGTTPSSYRRDPRAVTFFQDA